MLRQAQRCLWKYIAWLYEEAVPRRPSWAPDEINRAVRRLVELQVAVRKVRPTFPIDAVALSPVFVARRRSVSVRHKRKCQGATETAALRKRAVAPPLIFSGEFEFRFAGCTYFAMVSPRICSWFVSVVRNACTARSVQNNITRVRRTTNVQDESVGVRCYPDQIAQIVLAETDHSMRPVTPINF